MFMDATERRNSELIETAIAMHQEGVLLPDTYVLDVDAIISNARKIVATAKEQQVDLFFMLKQIGRNPYLAKRLMAEGFKGAVVVDFREAMIMMNHQIPLGNVGHLVQIPKALLREIMEYGASFLTVYSVEKMRHIHEVAKELGIKQKVLLRVVSEGDELYPGQYGGFELEKLPTYFEEFHSLDSIEIAGVTSFPCFLYNKQSKRLEETANVFTLKAAKRELETAGFPIRELNMPSATCVYTLPFLANLGGTQGEPGHALTGTTPLHAIMDMPEVPAMVYVSEVSHNFQGHAYVYGGGLYRRGNLTSVMIADDAVRSKGTMLPLPDENIDYYLEMESEQPVGATAVMAFRTQIFVTRSEVALVEGIQTGKAKLVGIYDSQGTYVRGGEQWEDLL